MNIDSLKHWALFSAPLFLMLGCLWLGFDSEVDVATYFKAHSQAHPMLASVLKVITDWSNPVFYVLYGAMLIQALRKGDFETRRYVLILLAVQVIVAVLCVHFIKRTVGRPRPSQLQYRWDPITHRGTFHSLPSGHTTEFVGWTLPLALRKHTTAITMLLGILVGLLGFSRIYLWLASSHRRILRLDAR